MIKTLKDESITKGQFFEGLLIELAERGYYKLNRYFFENGKYQNEVVMESIYVFGKNKEEQLKDLEETIRKNFPNDEIWMESNVLDYDINLEDFEDFGFFDTEEEQ